MVEREATFAWRAHVRTHATHTYQALGRGGTALLSRSTVRGWLLLAREVESAARGCLPRDGAVARRVLLSLCPCGGLCILLPEYAEDARRDFMVDDRLVILADNINTEFLLSSTADKHEG